MNLKYLVVLPIIAMMLLSGCGEEIVPPEEPVTPPQEPQQPTTPIPTEPTTPEVVTPEVNETVVEDENKTIIVVDQEDEEDKEIDLDSGYNIDDIELGEGVSKDLDDGEISSLIDDKITFDDDDYDVSEHLIFTDGVVVKGSESYSDFEDEPYLTLAKSSIKYEYRIEDEITLTDVTDSESLNIKFLGKDIKIVDAEDGRIVVRTAEDYYMDVGDSITKDGKTTTLVRVGSADAVVVDVDGVQETIPGGKTETVNGIEITNEETFYDSNGQNLCSATLVIGDDIEQTIDNGDYYDDEELWKYDIDASDGKLIIRLTLDEKHTKLDDDYEALAIGESISLPEGYLTITFKEVDVDYTSYELEDEGDYYKLSTGDEDINDDFKKIYLKDNGTFYEDDDFEDVIEGDYVILGDSEIKFYNTLNLSTGLDIEDLPDRDEDLLSDYGIIVSNPENWDDDGQIDFEIPENRLEATLNIQ